MDPRSGGHHCLHEGNRGPLTTSPIPQAVWAKLEGKFTIVEANDFFRACQSAMKGDTRIHVVLDCRTMVSYTAEARSAFVDWLMQHRDGLYRVAIVTEKTVWHMVVSTMALGARIPMKAFSTLDEALDWIGPSTRIDSGATTDE